MSEPASIDGHQRVAAFLLGLEPEVARGVLRTLKPDVVVDVARAMIELDPRLSRPEATDDLVRELARAVHGPRAARSCDEGELERMLGESLGKPRGEEVLGELRERRLRDRPFLPIEDFPRSTMARVLGEESNAVVALVLSFLEPSLASGVLALLEAEQAKDVVRRMATLVPPSRSVLRTIADDLARRMGAAAEDGDATDPSDRLRSVAELLKYAPPELESGAIEAIEAEDADRAGELRDYMFTWEDIAAIDKRSMQKILGTVDTKTLSIALKACSTEVEENVLGNLSTRVRQMVAEERELAGPMPMTEVEGARSEIMKSIRGLIASGEFRPSRAGEDLVT